MAELSRDIPETELEVLNALWRLGGGSVREVREELRGKGRHLAHTTVLTLLGRLERRGHVECNRDGAANVYRPLISREEVTADRLRALVAQLGEGKATPLILQLVQSHELSREDIRQLRKLLGELEAETRKAR